MVIADALEARETIVITIYEPDPEQWEPGFLRPGSPDIVFTGAEEGELSVIAELVALLG